MEIHLSTTATWPDLNRFAAVTDRWRFTEGDDEIMSDNPDDTSGNTAFAETAGGLEASTRLGFSTMAKMVSDTDCAEANGLGFDCTRANLTALAAGDTATLHFYLLDTDTVAGADQPDTPSNLQVSRDSGYDTATVSWALYDAVALYEIERVTAIQVSEEEIEYGDNVTFEVGGTQAGIDSYDDDTIESDRIYQYRVRARGAATGSWSDWTDYNVSGAKPDVDLEAPANVELRRGDDSVTVSWTAPAGSIDGYTVQRQELSTADGSTFFANVVTVSGDSWLAEDATEYTDRHILPGQTYEYRVAAVQNDEVGTYSDWFRTAPILLTLGDAPLRFRLLEGRRRVLDDRNEFWMGWDEVAGATDYEVTVRTFAKTGTTTETYIISDATYFHTAFDRVHLRVRARKLDTILCGSTDDDRCLSAWTGWYEVNFTAAAGNRIELPPTAVPEATPATDADPTPVSIKEDLESALEAAMGPTGALVDGSLATQFLVLVAAVIVAGFSVALSWRRGMAPLGVGMAAAIFILILFAGHRVLGTPVAWPVAAQILVAVMGAVALARQFGVLR